MKFQKRPAFVEAEQWTGDNEVELSKLTAGLHPDGDKPAALISTGGIGKLYDPTTNKWNEFVLGEWIVLDELGHLEIVRDDIFRATHMTREEAAAAATRSTEIPDTVPVTTA
jgi:hypothetical protein